MPKKKKNTPATDDFTSDLIQSLNKEHGSKVAYNLAYDVSPTHVKRWISTGSKQLDYIVANRENGGMPEGRIIEIFGPPSIGKSHLAIQIARSTQQMGGIVVYIDTENATSVENLGLLGGDIATAIRVHAAACAFNDAGVGANGVGITRLAALDTRGIVAVTVDCMTARIGDARSMWVSGKISYVYEKARTCGINPGQTLQVFAAVMRQVTKKHSAGAAKI